MYVGRSRYSSGSEVSLTVNGKAVGGSMKKVGGWHDDDAEKGQTP